jgi:hypothetical protein
METTLHRQLKELYADDPDQREVAVDGFRIDVVRGKELVEVQSASLSAIRDKVRVLLDDYRVLVVKPLAASKVLVKRKRKGGRVVSTRRSPRRETVYDLFLELVHFVGVFPHPKLTLHVLLTEQEEYRLPRKPRRWRGKDYRVEDRRLVAVRERYEFRTAGDLLSLLPTTLPDAFTTADIAHETDIPRWLAQKMAYCLRKTDAVNVVGKTGNSLLYGRATVDATRAA